jgi:hypothetical protein
LPGKTTDDVKAKLSDSGIDALARFVATLK